MRSLEPQNVITPILLRLAKDRLWVKFPLIAKSSLAAQPLFNLLANRAVAATKSDLRVRGQSHNENLAYRYVHFSG